MNEPCMDRCCLACGRTAKECRADQRDGTGLGRCCLPCQNEGPLHPKRGEPCEHQ